MRKCKSNVLLIGFMGSGKTSLGLRLSYRLQMSVLDTDKMIEQREGMTISELFASKGEGYFRDLETDLMREIGEDRFCHIYSLGGGTPVMERNRELIKNAGIVVYLKASPDVIYERLKHDTTRPLLQCEDPQQKIRELLAAREEAYMACADYVVCVDEGEQKQLVDRIAELVLSSPKNAWKKEEQKLKEKESMKILVINGPNLNFLGIREKAIYGNQDYEYLVHMIEEKAQKEQIQAECFQSNHEGAIIDRIQEAYFDGTDGIVINPGAYTHYSYAIHDALASVTTIPKVEIHISDITSREEFRKVSVTAPACDKQIYGQGLPGYLQAIDFILSKKA